MDTGWAVVGADGSDAARGSTYFFDTATWLQTDRVQAADGETGDRFGVSVAINGTTAIIGADGDDDLGTEAGAAYLFQVDTGQELTKLLPGDGRTRDAFGYSVAISDDFAVVGAYGHDKLGIDSGAAYVFDVTSGHQILKLLAPDGEAGDLFGFSVAISESTIIVGAVGDRDFGFNTGSAYIFDVTTGHAACKLIPSNAGQAEYFGHSVSIHGSTAVAGSYGDDFFQGSVYVFDAATGQETARLLASDGQGDFFGDGDLFGISVAVASDVVVGGATGEDANGTGSGSAYLFDVSVPVQAGVSIRNGSGLNSMLLTNLSLPILGSSWDTSLDCSGHAPSSAALVAQEEPFSGLFLAGGELLVDLSSPQVTALTQIHSGGILGFGLMVPNDTTLCGMTVSVQGIVLGAPGYELSNALDLVLGL
ncbi:MAG TPA: hypothetical protein ENJ50_07315 [Planctomycetaceae bacterium]|nr:hypothetical protein [Planctomycetaceae bacterium]